MTLSVLVLRPVSFALAPRVMAVLTVGAVVIPVTLEAGEVGPMVLVMIAMHGRGAMVPPRLAHVVKPGAAVIARAAIAPTGFPMPGLPTTALATMVRVPKVSAIVTGEPLKVA